MPILEDDEVDELAEGSTICYRQIIRRSEEVAKYGRTSSSPPKLVSTRASAGRGIGFSRSP